MRGSWKSLLVSPGQLVKKKGVLGCRLVVRSNEAGFIYLPMLPTRISENKVALTVPAATPDQSLLRYDFIEDHTLWKASPVVVECPGEDVDGARPEHLRILFGGVPLCVDVQSAKIAFKGLLKDHLRYLFDHLEVKYEKGKKPQSLVALQRACMKHLLDWSSKEIDEKIEEEANLPEFAEVNYEETLLHKDDTVFTMAMDDMEDEDLKKELEDWRLKKMAAARKLAKLREQMGGDPSSSSCGPVHIPVAAADVLFGVDGYSSKQASHWKPPGSVLSKESTWHLRWRAKADYYKGTGSFAFGPDTDATDCGAMFHALTALWAAYTHKTKVKCPWKFLEPPG